MSRSFSYSELYYRLKTLYDPSLPQIDIPDLGLSIIHQSFRSSGKKVLPGLDSYHCEDHNVHFYEKPLQHDEVKTPPCLQKPDGNIESNLRFHFPIISTTDSVNGVIILLHGLNEKKWDKYLPWAYELSKRTKKQIILFPIAFHMNRAPEEWSDKYLMKETADRRKKDGNIHTSLVNAAISTRLEHHPQRFFWSGLQTYMDILNLVRQIKQGKINGIASDSSIDFFGYSIGAFFSLIILMSDPDRLLSQSKLFAFCGGATMDRMYPASRYILDYEAALSLHNYFAKKVNNDFSGDDRLSHFLSDLHKGESYFKTMLLYHHFLDRRERRLKEMEQRIRAVVLKNDTVIPPVEVANTLNGADRSIRISVDVLDFPYPYSHVTLFTSQQKYSKEVTEGFDEVMQKAAEFFAFTGC